MTNKYKTLRFDFRDQFRFFCILFFMRENMAHWDSNALSNVPNRHLEVTFLCTWTQAILASTLENGKKIKNPQLWHNITNYREEKEASQPYKVDKASQDLSIDIVFRPIWSLFILVKYRTRYRGCWDRLSADVGQRRSTEQWSARRDQSGNCSRRLSILFGLSNRRSQILEAGDFGKFASPPTQLRSTCRRNQNPWAWHSSLSCLPGPWIGHFVFLPCISLSSPQIWVARYEFFVFGSFPLAL
jgi:hypothetical protein